MSNFGFFFLKIVKTLVNVTFKLVNIQTKIKILHSNWFYQLIDIVFSHLFDFIVIIPGLDLLSLMTESIASDSVFSLLQANQTQHRLQQLQPVQVLKVSYQDSRTLKVATPLSVKVRQINSVVFFTLYQCKTDEMETSKF